MNTHTPYCIFCGMGCDHMNRYDILNENTVIGTATVQQCGLFTQFDCACNLEKKELYRIVAVYEDKSVDLGICIVDGGRFVTQAKIPSKRLGIGTPKFYIKGKQNDMTDFIPLSRDMMFLHLYKIDAARFVIKDGVAGLMFNCPDLLAIRHNR